MAAENRPLVACLLKINGLPEFAAYKQHLQELRDEYRIANDAMRDPDIFRWNQGRVLMLNTLLEELEQSPALASKIGA